MKKAKSSALSPGKNNQIINNSNLSIATTPVGQSRGIQSESTPNVFHTPSSVMTPYAFETPLSLTPAKCQSTIVKATTVESEETVTSIHSIKNEMKDDTDLIKYRFSFLLKKLAILKVRQRQYNQLYEKSEFKHLSPSLQSARLFEDRPSWYFHTILRAYCIPYSSENCSSTQGMGQTLPLLIDRDNIINLQTFANTLTIFGINDSNITTSSFFQLVENERAVSNYFHSQYCKGSSSSLNDSKTLTDSYRFVKSTQLWLNYIHISLNGPLSELKSLLSYDKIESKIVNRSNINNYFNFNMRNDQGGNFLLDLFTPSSPNQLEFDMEMHSMRVDYLCDVLLSEYAYLNTCFQDKVKENGDFLFSSLNQDDSAVAKDDSNEISQQAAIETALFSHLMEALAVENISIRLFQNNSATTTNNSNNHKIDFPDHDQCLTKYQYVIEFVHIMLAELYHTQDVGDTQNDVIKSITLNHASAALELMSNKFQTLRMLTNTNRNLSPRIYPNAYKSTYKSRQQNSNSITYSELFDGIVESAQNFVRIHHHQASLSSVKALTIREEVSLANVIFSSDWQLPFRYMGKAVIISDATKPSTATMMDAASSIGNNDNSGIVFAYNNTFLSLKGTIYLSVVAASFLGFVAFTSSHKKV